MTTERRPLVHVDGRVKELPDGDAVYGAFVPTYLAGGTFVVPADAQAMFALPIELDGTAALDVAGDLIMVA